MTATETVTQKHLDQLRVDGFVIFNNVMSTSEIEKLRSFFESKLSDKAELDRKGNFDGYLFDIFGRYSEIRWLLYHEQTNDILRCLMGEVLVNLRATTVLEQKDGDWHNETTEIEKDGYSFHREEDCMLLQTIMYLQDNSGSLGPALEVAPGTHKLADPFLVRGKFKPERIESPETGSGDLIVFDWKLAHRATSRRDESAPKKLGIFGSYSNTVAYAHQYNDFLNQSKFGYMHDMSYPQDLLDEAKSRGIIVA